MSTAADLAPLAILVTPVLIGIIGALIGMMVRYFLAHMVASMARIESRVEGVCRDMREDYVTKDTCDARHECGRHSRS